ncbi:MAG: hypothetical protein F6K11_24805, partial [Leptolyngbya sp. SIO3F4]|nr:hypothetical protein [Leptolyngbya sp. SIO3F4]
QSLVPAIAPEAITIENSQPQVSDGVYLFSTASASKDNLANSSENVEYMVLQLKENQAIGGFYQPLSEYSCFTGTVRGERLDLWVSSPGTTDTYPYSVLTQLQSPVASRPDTVGLKTNELVLRDVQRIGTLDQVSQDVLNACLVELNHG